LPASVRTTAAGMTPTMDDDRELAREEAIVIWTRPP
jgi:hypothetical protein